MDDRVKNAKELVMIAKQLLAKKIDGIDILQEYEEILNEMVNIDNEIEELKRKKTKLSLTSSAVQDMYELAKDMRVELDKVLNILKKKGVKPRFSNDLGNHPSEYLSCTCFLYRDGKEFGLIAYSLFLTRSGNKPSLKIEFHSWNRDTDFELKIDNDKLLHNTLSQWKRFLTRVLKEM